MKHDRTIIGPSLLALAALLSGCSKQVDAPQAQQLPAVISTHQAPQNANATVLGAVKEGDWYLVVSAPGSAKPLVIWTESKPACERNVGEFSLKAVDPSSNAEPPKAWCMQGREIRSRLGV